MSDLAAGRTPLWPRKRNRTRRKSCRPDPVLGRSLKGAGGRGRIIFAPLISADRERERRVFRSLGRAAVHSTLGAKVGPGQRSRRSSATPRFADNTGRARERRMRTVPCSFSKPRNSCALLDHSPAQRRERTVMLAVTTLIVPRGKHSMPSADNSWAGFDKPRESVSGAFFRLRQEISA
jgi:hypothetical protein